MRNYAKELDTILQNLTGRPRLALHSCCAPCSSHVLSCLKEYFDITLYYYNPNIHPLTEYEKRLSEQLRLCEILGIKSVQCEYDPHTFFERTAGMENEPEGGARCTECFKLRLEKTAQYAKRDNIGLVTTTLTVSPHKNAELINEIGKRVSEKYGLEWLPSDFKKKNGYLDSINLSKKYDLYRQNYCGCIFSDYIKKEN